MTRRVGRRSRVYQSEFPVDQPVPVFDPTLVFLLVLAGLAIIALAFFAGRLTGRGDKGQKQSDAPKVIHEAIKAKCVAASSAHSGELSAKTQDLIDEVTLRIDPLLKFGGPCGKAFEQLNKAMKGERPEEKKDDHGKGDKHGHGKGHDARGHDKGHDKGHDHAAGHAGHDDPKATPAKAGVEVLSRNVTIVGSQTVLLTDSKPCPDDHHDDHHDDAPKPLEYKEHLQLLRLAVAEFSDFWNRKTCLEELQACQRALNETPKPADKPPGSGSGQH